MGEAETRARDAAKERGVEFGTKGYWVVWRGSGIDAAHDRERRSSDECDEAFYRLLNTPADSVQDMELKRRATLVQQAADSEPRDSTKLIEALGRDFERLDMEAQS